LPSPVQAAGVATHAARSRGASGPSALLTIDGLRLADGAIRIVIPIRRAPSAA
jgi:hypothetical protein